MGGAGKVAPQELVGYTAIGKPLLQVCIYDEEFCRNQKVPWQLKDTMKYLLKTGLTPNVQNLSSKTFPLLFASERKCYGSLKLMFKYKLNFSLKDYQK